MQITKRKFATVILLVCGAVGAALSLNPVIGLIVAAAVLFLGLLELGPTFLLGAALVAACASRILALAGLPRLVNYLHFALVIEAFIAVQMRRTSMPPLAVALARGLAATVGICFASWALNDGEVLRPVLMWMVLFEPFLAVLVLVQCRPDQKSSERLRMLAGLIVFVQLPFALFQSVRAHGDGDSAQGTFIGAGAGAHVAGGVALAGVLFCVAKALASKGRARNMALLGAVMLFVLPVIADAKQAIVCFLPGLLLVLHQSNRRSFGKLAGAMGLAAVVLGCAYFVYPPLQNLSNGSMLEQGFMDKMAAFEDLAGHMAQRPSGWLLGVGPGNSVSRIAVLSSESPLQVAHLRVSPVTADLLDMTKHNYLMNSSSAFSSISSWTGIVGDLGPLGLIAYLWIAALIWRELARLKTWQSYGAMGSIIMAAVLGGVYSWLEEPGFMLIIAIGSGLAITTAWREFAYREKLVARKAAGDAAAVPPRRLAVNY